MLTTDNDSNPVWAQWLGEEEDGMTVWLGPGEAGAALRQKRLQRAAAREGRMRQFAAALEVLVSLAKYLGAFGAIGLTMGVVVATKYGVDRAAVPQFSGDEWLPQLAGLGLFCGAFAMLLVTLPLLDSLARGSVSKRALQPWPSPPAVNSARLWGPPTVYLVEGLLLVLVDVCRPRWLESYPLFLFGLPLVCAGLDTVLAHWGAKEQWRHAVQVWFPQFMMLVLAHVFYVVLLALLMNVVRQQSANLTPWQLSGVLGLLALCLAVYRALAYGAVAVFGVGRELVVGLVFLVAVVGVSLSGEIVRASGLGNLPGVQIRLERGLACVVAERLQLAEWHHCVYHPDDGEDARLLQVDIVNRTGGHQVLAAPGMLRSKPTGKCTARPARPDAQARDFVCVEIGADAVQAVMR